VITLVEIQRLLLRYGITAHKEGGALIWNLTPHLGERELVIEIHEPHETTTHTRDLWVYAPNLVEANSTNAGKLHECLAATRDMTGYSASRALEGDGIGAVWSVPLDKLTPENRIPEWVRTLGNAVKSLAATVEQEHKSAGYRQVSPQDFDQVIGYRDEAPHQESPQPSANPLRMLAEADSTWEQKGDSDQALRQYNELLQLSAGTSPIRLKFQSGILSKMVQVIHVVGPPELGIEHATRALAIDRELYGDTYNDVSADYMDLAQLHATAGNPETARQYLNHSRQIDADLPSDEETTAAKSYRRISGAKVLQDAGFAEAAAQECLNAMPDVVRTLKVPHLGHALAIAADCLQDLGEHNIAEAWLRNSIEVERNSDNCSEVNVGIRLSNLAMLLHDTGRFEEAAIAMKEAQTSPSPHAGKENDSSRTFEREVQIVAKWMKAREGKYDIFISYNSRDELLVERLHGALESYGLNVFTFREDPTSKFPMVISEIVRMLAEHLPEMRSLVIVASPTSITSIFVRTELETALDSSLPVFAWYPQGTRFTPEAAAWASDVRDEATITFGGRLFDELVRSYYGLGVRGGSIEDLARAILFRYLLLSPNHPLRSKVNLAEMRSAVRHATRLWPCLVDKEGRPLLSKSRACGDSLSTKASAG
jgi:tetratricopeptide (TPR) repeat protein